MPILSVNDGEIFYEESGQGYPVLLFAPGFLGSRIERWYTNPSRPGVEQDWRDPIPLFEPHFRVVRLDVRNAGRSRASVGPDYDWSSYTADYLALLQHLGIEKCHVMGGCIGVSFALALEQAAPGTISAQVLQNPIGLSETNRATVDGEVAHWKSTLANRPDIDASLLRAAGERMFATDFIFSVTREYTATSSVPTLLMPGDDTMHPVTVSADLARLTRAEVLTPWKGPKYRDAAVERARDFLLEHTPEQPS
ncbi:pimeloyl-ACP methyl ester carboxylesterase [Rhizobium sp. BK313]|uniref:alpha/beta fold hydrolase n=1 Tax=Rhizobium sp. BK313 TaxID=2587081 RepID=UPI0010E2B646|nr:alpha/beta hydrolase [Rhizobium sp. BK313]MBB3458706.1 pimeloyl-ACP methyl ester carboxylesterase [Rhizobium sp. BK313]